MAAPFRLTTLCKTPKTSLPKTPILNNNNNPHTLFSRSNLKFNPISKPSTLALFITNRRHQHRHPRTTAIRCLFTGIVEEMGQIKKIGASDDGGFAMKIAAKTVLDGVNLGDSIAVNGTCLTVTQFDTVSSEFTVGLSPETLRKTSLSELSVGSPVNLERAVQPISRMGGHFVQGHVDGTGEIVSMEAEEDSLWIKVKTTREILKYVVPKGFVAVDGTSLTVVDVFDDEDCFNFMLVAYTQQKVVIPLKKIGQKVNLEVDIMGKYVERLLSSVFVDSVKSS
ncbi:Riboflavin synthase alpha chain [Morus notabilis]|uniref:Riboflavin synthase n=1 Tax=Morus notabilis TaxID=981085 RepID=W9STD1_9ROSA|nr:riboflavin synthase [Morus notabilis]EXC25510.1 Riboflavin synthase alpha chain [Morus notabilis]